MEAYAQALTYAIPGFVLLIIAEAIAARRMGKSINRDLDVVSSLSSGVTNTLKSIIGLSVIIISYDWMVAQWGQWEWQSTVLMYVVAFVGIDFAAYWSHRFNHEVNILWNRHLIHHSSEEFNLSCALRQPISNVVSIYFFLYIPMAIIGIPAPVIALLAPLHLFAQFWYHTRLINKMGVLEHIIVTPSHHRVHHAINPEYIDRNYAAIFILWDKWFGTFQEELPEVQPIYGTKKPARTWNPILINFLHFWQMLKDAIRTQSWKEKFTLWFRPTGYRPKDLVDAPQEQDIYQREKYRGADTYPMRIYAWIQLVAHNLILLWTLVHISDYNYGALLGMGGYLFLGVFAYTSTMDGHSIGGVTEVLKLGLGLYFLYFAGIYRWPVQGWTQIILAGYSLFSACSTGYLWWKLQRLEETSVQTEMERSL